MDKYGLIGFPLGHSFSVSFFNEKFTNENINARYINFEIPQIVNDFGEQAIEFIGSTDKQIKFKVYTSSQFKFHKYKTRGKQKPFVYIDTTPNEHNFYDCYLFNAPMLERLTVIAIFKDPRQVEQVACCNLTEADNMSWIASEVKNSLINKKLKYYRQSIPQPLPNTQNPA